MRKTLTIPGDPVAKARPRVCGKATYTPTKTKNYKTLVKELYFGKYGQTVEEMEGMLKLTVNAYFQIPKSKSKRVQEMMHTNEIRPIKRPDIDNIVKSISDALNNVAYADDSQIVEVVAGKYYAHSPRVEIFLEKI
ncbi:RusA family crossover junction endodeoxyribonuclease [Bacteroides heparinolyticus]|uniref:RusA family crossover junction endodeoxyribonuclease n=1 Tax=Prevotella heparinolytica TaxID=28113 RepID=UPI00359F61D5